MRWVLLLVAACSDGGGHGHDAGRDGGCDAGLDASADLDASLDAAVDSGADESFRWEELDASGDGPFGRWGWVAADLGDGTAILFGGTTIDVMGDGERLGDTWLADVRGPTPAFARLETVGLPAPRYCGCMAYDRARGLVILIGGRDTAPLEPSTWVLDVATSQWTDLGIADTPPGSVGCAMAYSPDDDATILFGGGGLGQYDDGTYRFDAEVPAWTRLDAAGPSARYDAVLRWIGPGEPLLLFGGALGAIGQGFHADVWRFDVATETWTEMVADGAAPPGRRVGWLAVEPDLSGFVVGMGVTGIQPQQVLSDLWRFDFSARRWTEQAPANAPPARGFSPWLPAGAGTVGLLLGGFDNQTPRADLWRLLPPEGDTRW